MRVFKLLREEDESGISGTGVVAEGVVFSSGKCALGWLSGPKDAGRSVCVYDSIGDVERIHGHGGKTKVLLIGEVLSE